MSVLVFTDCLQIFFAALESPLERPAFVHARVAIAQLAMALLVASIAVLVQHGGLESAAKIALVVIEFAAVGLILFFFGAAQTHPPHSPRTINTLSSGMLERAAHCVSFTIISHHREDGSPFAQPILVNIQFIFRQSFEHVALQLSANGPAANRTQGPEYHAASHSNRKHRPNAGNQQTRDHRNQSHAAGNAHSATDNRTNSFTHAWLLAGNRRHSRNLLITRVGRQNRDAISWNIQGH